MEIPSPLNVKQLRTVLGMFGWYSQFIENEAEKKIPLVKLLRKETPWEWGEEENKTFESLKRALIGASVLARLDFLKTFTIHADASQYVIGAVLTQEDEEQEEHPIVYISRVLTPAAKKLIYHG